MYYLAEAFYSKCRQAYCHCERFIASFIIWGARQAAGPVNHAGIYEIAKHNYTDYWVGIADPVAGRPSEWINLCLPRFELKQCHSFNINSAFGIYFLISL